MTEPSRRIPRAVAQLVTTRPWLALAASFAMLVAIGFGLPKITVNFTHTAFFKKTDPNLRRFDAFERRFGNDDAVIVVIQSPDGIFDQDSARYLQAVTHAMWQVSEVIRVDSLSNFNWVHAEGDEIEIEPLLPKPEQLTPELLAERKQIALRHEVLPGYLVSRDAKTAVVYARIKPGLDVPPDAMKISADTRRVLASIPKGDHVVHLSGNPPMTDAFREASEKDMSVLVPGLLLTVALLLFATLRRLGGIVMPFVVIATSIVSALAFSGWLGLEMSSVTFMLPQVLIAVCVADTVHLLVAFYRARKAGVTRAQAAAYTLEKNFVATLLTSVTTALGFFSFLTAQVPPIANFGVLAGIGTMIAWVFTYSMVGALMTVWPGKEPTLGATDLEDTLHDSTPTTRAYVGLIERRRLAIALGFGALVAVSAFLATLNVVNSNPYKYFKAHLPVRQSLEFILANLDGIGSFEVVVDSGREDGVKDPVFLRKVEQLEARAMQIPGIKRAVSIVDILRQMNRALSGGSDADYKLPATKEGVAQELLLYTMGLPQGMDVNDRITVKNDALRITLVSTITGSNEAIAATQDVERIARELGLRAHVTGKMLLYQGMNGVVVQSFITSLLAALVMIGLIMLVSFKSLRLGLISIVPNVVPLVLGGAVLYFLTGTVDMGTVMVASVSLGLAVDNTIHILSNFVRDREQGTSVRAALERVFAHSGPAMLSTTLILVLGFSTLALGDFVPNVYFGVLTAIVLTIGLVADFVLLPALLLLFVPDGAAQATPAPAAVDAKRAA